MEEILDEARMALVVCAIVAAPYLLLRLSGADQEYEIQNAVAGQNWIVVSTPTQKDVESKRAAFSTSNGK